MSGGQQTKDDPYAASPYENLTHQPPYSPYENDFSNPEQPEYNTRPYPQPETQIYNTNQEKFEKEFPYKLPPQSFQEAPQPPPERIIYPRHIRIPSFDIIPPSFYISVENSFPQSPRRRERSRSRSRRRDHREHRHHRDYRDRSRSRSYRRSSSRSYRGRHDRSRSRNRRSPRHRNP
ncbi:hypothetical protein QTN25_000363 [Entamoeba marina]